MADYTAIAAVTSSLVRFLQHCFTVQQPISDATTTTVLSVRTEDLDTEEDPLISAPALSLFLYRVDVNKTMRAAWSGVAHATGTSMLPLDFHYLFIPWGGNADHEYRILGRTMQCLEDTPILSGPLLDPITDWAPGESIQISQEELSTEDVMRTFDSLPIDYKLCVPYLARIVVVEGRRAAPAPETGRADLEYSAEVDP